MSDFATLCYFVDAHMPRYVEVGRLLKAIENMPKGQVVIVDGDARREDLRSLLDVCAEMLAAIPPEACRESGYDLRHLLKIEKHPNLFYCDPLEPIARRPCNPRIAGMDIRKLRPRRMR